MQPNAESPNRWLFRPSLHPVRAQWLRRLDAACQIIAVTTIIAGHGLQPSAFLLPWPAAVVVLSCMLTISVGIAVRYFWSLAPTSFLSRHWQTVWAVLIWLGLLLSGMLYASVTTGEPGVSLGERIWIWSVFITELVLLVYSLSGFVRGLRKAAAGGVSPAYLLLLSFVLVISVGTAVLMLPVSRRQDPTNDVIESAPLLTALFTSTSACCVTGLVVEDTGPYWSRVGQSVIMLLFQIGGLGIMTFGAFFAVIAGRNARVTEVATIRDMLAADALGDVRRLVQAIAGFTFGTELLGAILLLPHFSHLPWGERIYQSVFHSVSAFNNAGFALTPNSFVGDGERWTVWGVVAGLIIIGGLGFAVLFNVLLVCVSTVQRLLRRDPTVVEKRIRLTLTAKLVLVTTACLLVGGTAMIYGLERCGSSAGQPINLADSWFQSVTLRTAGFNTVELGQWKPATKLFGIVLMVIGASPGSTGGGVKTVVFAIAMLGLYSVIRGREHVEVAGRTIPFMTFNRALAIFFVSVFTVMLGTLLVVIIEDRPEYFIDHLFEVSSAVGTVGLTSMVPVDVPTADGPLFMPVTKSLSDASRLVIIACMFLGRVGPLTLLLALAGETPAVRYEYPQERVTLG